MRPAASSVTSTWMVAAPVRAAVAVGPSGAGPSGVRAAARTTTVIGPWSGLLPVRVRVASVIAVGARAGMAFP